MPKHADPKVFYPLLIEAFREEPGNVNAAANKAGVTWNTANKAWEKGHMRVGYGPIKELIKQEQQRARTLIEAERQAAIKTQQAEGAKARENAIAARKQEGQMTGLVRASTLHALAAVGTLAKEARQLAEAINSQVALERQKLDQWTAYEAAIVRGDPAAAAALKPPWVTDQHTGYPYTVDRLLAILNRSADYAGKITHCARQAMEMERVHLGEPIATIGVVDERREISLEEADTRRENALVAIERARASGGLRMIPGGKAEPVVGQRVIVR